MVVQCRSCLSTTAAEYISMESIMSGENTFLDSFNECTQLKASFSDDLPLVICSGCAHDLQISFDFLQVARQADAALRENVANLGVVAVQAVEGDRLALMEEECVMEEILEDDTDDVAHIEIMELEALEEHILEDTTLQTEDDGEKPRLEEIEVDSVENIVSPDVIKKEKAPLFDICSEDETDDFYLTEYSEKHNSEAAPSGSKWKCTKCKRVLRGDVSYEGHMNMHKGVKPYKCSQCESAFRCKSTLERHAELRHQEKAPTKCFLCTFCNKAFRLTSLLKEHQRQEHEFEHCSKCLKTFDAATALEHMQLVHATTPTIQCPHCSLAPFPRFEIEEHFRLQHSAEYRKHFAKVRHVPDEGEKTWTCDVCTVSLPSEDALDEHRNTHVVNGQNQCNICGKRFIKPFNLRNHMGVVHSLEISNTVETAERLMQCEICKKILRDRKRFAAHMAMHEKKSQEKSRTPSKFLCSYCQRECKSQKALSQHTRMHDGESPDIIYVCVDCDRPYNTQHLLEQHRRQAHKERDNVCPICGNAFKLKNQLVNHMKLHLEKNIPCPLCDKRYARHFDLNVHMRSHTGELPFACHLCDKRFAIKVRLTYHIQKHYGVKHTCKECDAQFNSKQKLKAHSYKHSGMPYRCDICDDHGFANRDVFKRHLLRVHNTTMTDDALVEMFQRNTGKTTRIRQIDDVKPVVLESDELEKVAIAMDGDVDI